MKAKITSKQLWIYVLAIAFAWFLTEIVWGATVGVVGGLAFSRHPEYQQNVQAFLKGQGIEANKDMFAMRATLAKLPPEDRKTLNGMSQDIMRGINWFAVTILVSSIVFGGVGFLSGLISKSWLLSPLIPAMSFFLNNPVIRFSMAKELPLNQKIIVVLIQFIVCSLLAFSGASIAMKMKRNPNQVAGVEQGVI